VRARRDARHAGERQQGLQLMHSHAIAFDAWIGQIQGQTVAVDQSLDVPALRRRKACDDDLTLGSQHRCGLMTSWPRRVVVDARIHGRVDAKSSAAAVNTRSSDAASWNAAGMTWGTETQAARDSQRRARRVVRMNHSRDSGNIDRRRVGGHRQIACCPRPEL
jgi:hypothetical protein